MEEVEARIRVIERRAELAEIELRKEKFAKQGAEKQLANLMRYVEKAERERKRMEDQREEQKKVNIEKQRVMEENERKQAEEQARTDSPKHAASAEGQNVEGQVHAKPSKKNRKRINKAKKAHEVRLKKVEQELAKATEDLKLAKLEIEEGARAREQAERKAAQARVELQQAEKALNKVYTPIVVPSRDIFIATKKRLEYHEGMFHFAIAGTSGSGKSSLINAVRGLKNSSKSLEKAPVGVIETTKEIRRYVDPDSTYPFAWYDIPGAGTLDVPDWTYFNDHGLYVFDCIIVLFDNRFLATDVAILRNCARFQIPTYIVRTKSKQHITNLTRDLVREDGEDEARLRARARTEYINKTKENVAENLESVNLPQQRVYMIDKDNIVETVCGKEPDDYIDELRGVFALILSTASDLWALLDNKDNGIPRPTVALWSVMIRGLVRSLSREIYVLANEPFIVPRTVDGERSKLIDGTATLLFSYVLTAADTSQSSSSKSEMEVDPDDERESIHLPFDAHLLPGHGRRFSAVIPAFVVADSENIVPLMCSMLYQQHVLGIREPAVGVVLENSGVIGQVVLGWLDHNVCLPNQLPTPHLAFAVGSRSPDSSLGIFDLTDSISAFAFAHFILGLHEHFRDIGKALSMDLDIAHPPISWRSDLIDCIAESGEHAWKRTRLE
ncbi:uncharacterized protein FIBRA_07347 [Fibroporia radiculosa]|uniref:IRG-type G domain-containing protein n=1 Tax=Fibroporia radiculosa TaxID=599839 RepID=J4H4K3_9APHY|nr:uncharacterized protein FIBRA_07347 [Fibroporia radiculosa]CCM05139.1 predicted protein [Fibroporia radiculosa]